MELPVNYLSVPWNDYFSTQLNSNFETPKPIMDMNENEKIQLKIMFTSGMETHALLNYSDEKSVIKDWSHQ